ncbi:MAG: endonuclease [Blastococcus sp.]|nr:endonuclease [Blastococcus sp.]
METKFCRDCGEDRPLTDFTKNRNSRDGYDFYCRVHARRRHRTSRDDRTGPPTRRHARDIVVPAGHKWCPDCGEVLPFEAFGRNAASSTGRASYCKPCHNVRGRKSKELVGGERTYHLRRRYGITAQEADAMLEAQGGVCAICRAAPAVHVDHIHSTGRVRALLCFNCNGGLGQFRDNPAVLQAAVFYVEHHNQQQAIEQLAAASAAAVDGEPEAASRPGEPPVGSHRRPEARGTTTRSTGRTSGARRREQAGEADA